MKGALVLATTAVLLASGCGGSDTTSAEPTKPSPTGGSGACVPSGTGTTDLKTKPTVEVPKAAAPTETTVVEIVCGTGEEAKDGTAVEVKYVGVLYADGKEFDSSWSRDADETLPFTIGSGVIDGFSKGATGMRVGGRRAVLIPSKDAYKESGSGPVPGGAALIFVIDLVKVG